MKKILFTIAALVLFANCMNKEIDISQKQIRNGVVYTINQETPYTGKVIGKYENGQIKIKENFKNGKYDGEQLSYFENGQIKEKINFENGVAVGTYYEYHKNGEIAYTGTFFNGKKNGNWNRYTDEKKLILTETYENGDLKDIKQFLIDTNKIKGKIKSIFE